MNSIDSLINAITENPIISGALIWVIGAILSRFFKKSEEKPERPEKSPPPLRSQEKQETVQAVYERVQRENNKNLFSSDDTELNVVKLSRSGTPSKKAMTENPAAQGVIWAEIIGKPRSANPHYTKRFK